MVPLAAISGLEWYLGLLRGVVTVRSSQRLSSPVTAEQWDKATLLYSPFALHRAQGQCLQGSHVPPSGSGHHDGLCPHNLCPAGPAVLEEGEGTEVSKSEGWGPAWLGEEWLLPQEAPRAPAPLGSLPHASSSFAGQRRVGFPKS